MTERHRPDVDLVSRRFGFHPRPLRFADLRRFGAAVRGPLRGSAFRAMLDGAVVVTTLRRRGLRPLLRDPSALPVAEALTARQVADAVDAGLGLLPVATTCLRRSATLMRELHRLQMGATLHIGVRTGGNGSGIEAHAWVQVLDQVINDDAELVETYTRLSVGQAERLLPGLT